MTSPNCWRHWSYRSRHNRYLPACVIRSALFWCMGEPGCVYRKTRPGTVLV